MGVKFKLIINGRVCNEADRWCWGFLRGLMGEVEQLYQPVPDGMAERYDPDTGEMVYCKKREVSMAVTRAYSLLRDYGVMPTALYSNQRNYLDGVRVMQAFDSGNGECETLKAKRRECLIDIQRNFPYIFPDHIVIIKSETVEVGTRLNKYAFYNILRLIRNVKRMSASRCAKFLKNPDAQLVMLSSYIKLYPETGDEGVFHTEALSNDDEYLKAHINRKAKWLYMESDHMRDDPELDINERGDSYIAEVDTEDFYDVESDSCRCLSLRDMLERINELTGVEA